MNSKQNSHLISDLLGLKGTMKMGLMMKKVVFVFVSIDSFEEEENHVDQGNVKVDVVEKHHFVHCFG